MALLLTPYPCSALLMAYPPCIALVPAAMCLVLPLILGVAGLGCSGRHVTVLVQLPPYLKHPVHIQDCKAPRFPS